MKVFKNFAAAHNQTYDKLHEISRDIKIGLVNAISCLETNNEKSFLDKFSVIVAEYFGNKRMLKLTKGENDFLAFNYYFRKKIKFPLNIKEYQEETSDFGLGHKPRRNIFSDKKINKKANYEFAISALGNKTNLLGAATLYMKQKL